MENAIFQKLTRELFLFDQLYRKFHEFSNKADLAGWDVLKTIRDKVEDCYSKWFMMQLSLIWGDFLTPEHPDNLMKRWRVPGVANQYDFFDKYVQPTVQGSSRNRLFVIISDAFRYEASDELTKIINGKYRLKADLEPMLGVVPSYTELGMASLLPHRRLSFKPKGDIVVDDKATGSTALRADILSLHEGTAIKADELMVMSKDKGREFVKPYRIIYIFHDQIDATGDKAVSEGNTFEAVRKTIDDLYALISFIINSLNGTNVIFTADHGFIYQEKPPEPMDKSKIEFNLENAVKTHKRFILGKKLNGTDNTFFGNTKNFYRQKNLIIEYKVLFLNVSCQMVKLRICVHQVDFRYLIGIVNDQEYLPIIIDLKKGRYGENLSLPIHGLSERLNRR